MRSLKPQPSIQMRKLSSIDESGVLISSRTISNNFLNTVQDQKKLINNLQKVVKEQKQKRQQAEQKYEQFKQRGVHRQQQFYKIIARMQKKHTQIESNEQKYINQLYNKILHTFNAFNQKARELLQDRYNELYRLLQRRIDILMQKMQKELSKYRKLSESQLKEVRYSIKEMTAIAAQVEEENNQLRIKDQSLSLKNKLLIEEKKLMLEQIAGMKLQLAQNLKRKNTQRTQQKQKQFTLNLWKKIQSIDLQNDNIKQILLKKPKTSRNYRYLKNIQVQTKNLSFNNHKTIQVGSAYSHSQNKNSIQKSLNHFRLCLQRQKNKNAKLIKFSLELESKQDRIKQLIEKQLARQKTRSSQTSILCDQKVQNIKNIKNDKNLKKDNQKKKSTKDQIQSMLVIDSEFQIKKKDLSRIDDKMKNLLHQIKKILAIPQNTFQNIQSKNQDLSMKVKISPETDLIHHQSSCKKKVTNCLNIDDIMGLSDSIEIS